MKPDPSVEELRRMLDALVTPCFLAVDDDADVLDTIATSLRPFNCDLLLARNGVEAISILQRYHVDLLLLDLIMPIANGFDVLQWMEDYGDETRSVVITGDPTNPLLIKALELGPVTLMAKPWTLKAFRKVLNLVPFARAEYALTT